ncbi:BatD family protein [Sansalvadorimonas verongulae]|uniref:BatD family protein n=1 Tax=Sansalvadorimonas verongulae TaxID=2172824 RepID=UPI0012BD1BCA|nr:BatD family protein [Sansalvadorimonas verongulae]MTI15392.1 protein BatD [Sansalvadorimonas verongulae]
MVKPTTQSLTLALALTLTLLLQGVSMPVFAALTATVDKLKITEDEPIRYSLESDNMSLMGSPDFSPLEKDFVIVSRGQSRMMNFSNGQNNSTTTWNLILQPKRLGTLTIPSITFDKDASQPISVEILKANNNAGTPATSRVYIRSSISTEELWQNQEAILTLRIYSQADYADSPNLTPPAADNAIFKVLGKDEDEEQVVNGIRQRVITRRYVVSPTQAGTITIPGQVLTGYIEGEDPYGRSRLMRMTRPEPFRAISADMTLKVNPIPASWPADKPWLPAEKIELTESWSSDTTNITAGDSVTRTVKIRAQGSNSAQIPPLPTVQLDSVKTYPDQPVTEDTVNSRGPLGVRSESVAFVPTQAGDHKIPPINITWFNTRTQQVEVAHLAGQTITVLPGSAASVHAQPVVSPSVVTQTPAITAPAPIQTQAVEDSGSLLLWKIATGVFGVLWLGTLAAYLRNRRLTLQQPQVSSPRGNNASNDEQKAFKALIASCDTNNLFQIESSLKGWGRQFLGRSFYSAGEVIETLNTPTLSQEWALLQKSSYSENSQKHIDANKLAEALKLIRKKTVHTGTKTHALTLDAINP